MASSPPQTLRKPVRELLRKRGEPMSQEIKLQDRGDEVRMALIKAAYEQYDEVPETVTQWYDPQQNAVVIPLPDPSPDDNNQSSLEAFSDFDLEGTGGIGGSGDEQQDSSPCHNSDPAHGQMSRGARPEVRDND